MIYYARQNEKVFADYIANKNNVELSRNISKLEREIAKLQKRESKLKSLFKKIYEDNALGKISDSIFENLSEEYLSEQNDIKAFRPKKIEALDNLKLSINNSKVFIEKARKYTEITELSIELLNLFIEKIIVSDTIKDDNGNKFQSIDIYYRDVGLLNEVI